MCLDLIKAVFAFVLCLTGTRCETVSLRKASVIDVSTVYQGLQVILWLLVAACLQLLIHISASRSNDFRGR